MFSNSTMIQLKKMRIDRIENYQYLSNKFDKDLKYFDELIFGFTSVVRNDQSLFVKYCDAHNIDADSDLSNYLKEMFDNICRYNEGVVFELFKGKQAEWGAPRVNLRPEDAPRASDINMLNDEVTIYRGMSKNEYDNKSFTQHWTTDANEAVKFATTIYSDLLVGVVAEAKINKQDVIHYDSNHSEKEVIPKIKKIREIKLINIDKL